MVRGEAEADEVREFLLLSGASTPFANNRAVSVRTARHQLWLFPETGPFWAHVQAAIEQARHRVWISTYIYRNDRLGTRFGELLARARSRDLDVRLLYDPQGSRGETESGFDWLRERGVQVRSYRRWSLTHYLWRYFPRDHGRLLIVDDEAFTGGINWGEEWLPAPEGGGWHDVAIGVSGPRVDDFRRAFVLRWEEATSSREVSDHRSELATTETEPDVEFIADSPSALMLIFEELCAAVTAAQRRVWLENSYCVPPRRLLRALETAVARGVDVRIMLPGETDLPIVRTITRGEYREWLASGFRIYEYQTAVMHSKFVVIDDDWCTIGTFNAMTPGLWWANETNVVVRDAPFTRELASVFLADLARCRPIADARSVDRGLRALWNRIARRVYRALEWCGTHLANWRDNANSAYSQRDRSRSPTSGGR